MSGLKAVVWRACKCGITLVFAHFLLEYCENFMHESLAQAEGNNMTYDKNILEIWALFTTNLHCQGNPEAYVCRFF